MLLVGGEREFTDMVGAAVLVMAIAKRAERRRPAFMVLSRMIVLGALKHGRFSLILNNLRVNNNTEVAAPGRMMKIKNEGLLGE